MNFEKNTLVLCGTYMNQYLQFMITKYYALSVPTPLRLPIEGPD
jgi:hypothetical protein